MKFKIPIVVKLIFLTVSILVASTALFVKTSTDKLTETLQFREEDANKYSAKSKATEVENILYSTREKIQSNATLLLDSIFKSKTSPPTTIPLNSAAELVAKAAETTPETLAETPLGQLQMNFKNDPYLLSIDIYSVKDGTKLLISKTNDFTVSKIPELTAAVFEALRVQANVSKIAQKTVDINNLSLLGAKYPVVSIGIPFVQDSNGYVTHVAIAYYQLNLLQRPFSGKSERTYFLMDRFGYLLAHTDEQLAIKKLNMKEHDLKQKGDRGNHILVGALSSSKPELQTSGIDLETGEEWYVAYVKNATWGTTVISQIEKKTILEPARDVKIEAIRTAGYMIAVAIVIITIFSLMLTAPLEKLSELIQIVAKGNFNVKARSFVKSADEVGELAIVFDQMTEGLKERDKVKNLFSKFHGSSVAEDLLKKDVTMGGQNKEVTIFFSDIRGFTSFSEKRTPEQVVEMLNSYFEVMVKIITRNGGVVDKFIGDAIMAVWGAPQTTPRDTQNALKACLEMRKALEELNTKRAQNQEGAIMIGMGLHSGPAISGTIGSSERMEYTVIGDTVNMTSRIEASTKAFGTDLLISQYVVDKVGEEFKVELAGSAEVKGKSEPLKLYKVRGSKDPATGQYLEITTPYSDYTPEHVDKVKVAS